MWPWCATWTPCSGPTPSIRLLPASGSTDPAQADRLNRDLLEELTAEGRCFLSGTLLRGVFHLRLAILAARTHKAQVDEVLDRLRLAAAR